MKAEEVGGVSVRSTRTSCGIFRMTACKSTTEHLGCLGHGILVAIGCNACLQLANYR